MSLKILQMEIQLLLLNMDIDYNKENKNVDLHIKLIWNEKDAVGILNKLENATLRNIAMLIVEDTYKVDLLNKLWAIGKKLDLYNK